MKKIMVIILYAVSFSFFVFSSPLMIEIKGDIFNMGDSAIIERKRVDDDGVPVVDYTSHRVEVDDFKISKFEITFSDYYTFIKETNYQTHDEKRWLERNEGRLSIDVFRRYYLDPKYSFHPVTSIAYEDALMFCLWLSRKTGKQYRLPTEAEWEFAATSGKNKKYPWGNNFQQLITKHTNEFLFDASFIKDVYPVDYVKFDKTENGVFGMYGNAMEWCLDAFDPLFYKYSPTYNPLQYLRKYFKDMSFRGFPGYSLEDKSLTVQRRLYRSPFYSEETIGFRVVEEINQTIFNKGEQDECIFFYANAEAEDKILLYEKPSASSSSIKIIDRNAMVRVYFKTFKKINQGMNENYWYCVRLLDSEQESELDVGWVSEEYLNLMEIEFN